MLTKGAMRYVFRCEPGREHELLNQLAEQVRDPHSALDWFDAAVISHHMGQRMKSRLQQLKAG